MDQKPRSPYRECIRLMDDGKDREALRLTPDIQDNPQRAGILIDAGFGADRLSAVREGIKIIEDLLSPERGNLGGQTRSYLLYNLANGHMNAFLLRVRKSKKWIASPNDDDMRAAKFAYREAIAALGKEPKSLKTQLWVNYGNCLSDFGRGIEAISCYRNALAFDEDNGVAVGNLGIELERVARITGRYLHDYLLEARSALDEALTEPRHLGYAGPGAAARFKAVRDGIEHFFASHRRAVTRTPAPDRASEDEKTSEYIKLCQEKQLFLNAWVGDAAQVPAYTDELSFPSITTDLTDDATVPELLEILNEIKESYGTARFLYFLSFKSDATVEQVSSLTDYFFAQGAFGSRGVRMGFLKTAYARAFDVLDKVARIVNVYFRFGKREDSFWRVLVVKQSHGQENVIKWALHPVIAKRRNPSLYALGDLAIDYFESEHVDFKTIDRRRNLLTHDYLKIEERNEDSEEGGERSISESAFRDATLRVLSLARLATLYAVNAISIEERVNGRNAKKVTIRYESAPGL